MAGSIHCVFYGVPMSLSTPPYPRTPATPWVVSLIVLTVGCWLLGLWSAPLVSSTWQRLFPQDPAAASDADGPTVWYQSQMHPWVIQPFPGTCPICGMDLTPVDPARFGAEVTVSPITVQNIGVRSQTVVRDQVQRQLRSVGMVEYDPGRVQSIVIRSGAWVENMSVRALGDRVRTGDHLFDLSSQELYAAQVEYVSTSNEKMRQSMRRRLAYLGMFDSSILDDRDEPLSAVPLTAPLDGVVIARNAEEGQRLAAGTTALRIADDSVMWLRVTLFEHQVQELRDGMTVQVQTRSGEDIAGRIAFIEPMLDPNTRTLVARIEVDNHDHRLRAGDYAQVQIPLILEDQALLVPRSAVVSSGRHDRVFIDLGRGRFAPREVQLGLEDDRGRVVIREGLEEGERIVVSGQYLIDAESRMIEAIARQIFPDRKTASAEPSPSSPEEPSAGPWDPFLESYTQLLAALYADDAESAQEAAEYLVQRSQEIDDLPTSVQEVVAEWPPSQELPALRRQAGALGVALRDTLSQDPRRETAGWTVFYCGMADAPEDGVWLQEDADEARNPFYGARHGMRACHVRADVLSAPEEADGQGDDAANEDTGLGATFAQHYADLAMALYAEDIEAIGPAMSGLSETTEVHEQLSAAIQDLVDAEDLAQQRRAFGTLSIALRDHAAYDPSFADWTVFYCGMADAPEEGVWLQDDADEARNPFYGARHGMRACHVDAHMMGDQR
ncbi:MAG: efflux RND transporter periplasmic adaptor subunit [Planctomycetota bacterium]|nr:MAG: efflux RND transporter periplasmic adaptor subunit [Planctomycetota bacterium]